MANLLNKSTDNSKARYVKHDGDPQHAGFKLTRAWERFDATVADSKIVALNSVDTYGSPQADGQVYSGKFIQSSLEPRVRDDDAVDIIQNLTKVKLAVVESDADIVAQIGDPATSGYELSRAWHISGKFVVSGVRSEEQADRTYDIIQDMVKVKTIDSVGDLTDPLIDRAKDIIHPFGEGTGVGRDIVYRYLNLDPASDTKCMALADTELVSRMSQNDSFIHVKRQTKTETNRTMTFWVLAQRKQRIAWSDTVFANPDHIEDQSVGRDNTIRRKTWYGIDNDCYAAVKTRLETDTDTLYSIAGYTVRDNDDGSDDWTQTLIKQFNDTRTDSKIINTHGIEHNGIRIRNYRYDNYASESDIPNITGDTNWKFEQEKVWMDERGLISKRVVLSNPDPSNKDTDADGSPDSYQLTNIRSGQHTDMDSIAVRTRYMYEQVPLSRVDSVMRTLDIEADARYIVEDINYRDIGNGAAEVNRDRKKINFNGSWFIEDMTASVTRNTVLLDSW